MLKKDHIDTESAACAQMENLQGRTTSSPSYNGAWDISLEIVTSYIDGRCETEVIGFSAFSWKTILRYHWQPFRQIVVCSLLTLLSIRFYYKTVNRLPELREVPYEAVVGKEVATERKTVHEIVVEKETSPEEKVPLIKQICRVEGQLYSLHHGVVLDAQNGVPNRNGKKMSLSPQRCQILKFFPGAPNYTVTGEDTIKSIWKGQPGVQTDMFCPAGGKLGKGLEQVGCGVRFRRFESDRHRMLFIGDLVDSDLT